MNGGVCDEVSGQLHKEIHNGLDEYFEMINGTDVLSEESLRLNVTRIANSIQKFELSPALLDTHLSYYMESLTIQFIKLTGFDEDLKRTRSLLAFLVYNFAKIRGYKEVTNFFSCNVYLLSKLITLAESSQNDIEIFTCLLWLCNLALVPFPLSSIDSQLAQSLYNIGFLNLVKHKNLSRNQVVSLILLSRLLARSDTLQSHILLLDYFNVVEHEWFVSCSNDNKLGHLITINLLLKIIPYDDMKQFIPLVYKILAADMLTLHNQSRNNYFSLYTIKILGKLALSHLSQRQFDKVSLIVNNLLNDVMTPTNGSLDVSIRYGMAKSLSNICSKLNACAPNYQHQLLRYMLAQFPIGNMSLDRTEIFDAELTINFNHIDIPKLHFLILFLGYTIMKRSMPHTFMPIILSIIHKTLFLQQKGSAGDIASPIRDSCCFVVWATCQTISHQQYQDLFQHNESMFLVILCDFILAAVSDPDLTVRKCSVAVVQELVGRYGQSIFRIFFTTEDDLGTFTVDLVELLDTRSLANHARSFALISQLEILGFDRRIFIPRLLENIVDESIAHDLRILSLDCIINLYRESDVTSPICPSAKLRNINLSSIIETLMEHQTDVLFAICDLYPLSPSEPVREFIEKAFESFDYTLFDSMEKAYGYVRWMTFRISQGDPPRTLEWTSLFSIASASSNKHIMESFAHLCRELDNQNIPLLPEITKSFERLIRRDNLILAYSVFNVGNLGPEFLDRLILMMHDKKLHIDTRECLVQSLTERFSNIDLSDDQLLQVIQLLDDYTITTQGDVGSKLRLATIRLIKKSQLWSRTPIMQDLIKQKLTRLSAEVMDKLRLLALDVLGEMCSFPISDISQMSVRKNFDCLFQYYQSQILSSNIYDLHGHFWSGYVFSMGSLSSPAIVMDFSFKSFLRFYDNASLAVKSLLLFEMAKLLLPQPAKDDRILRCQLSVLNCFVKLLEANIHFPVDFDYSALFVRCYNLHINTTNMLRIGLVLKVFQNLILSRCAYTTKIKCAKRLVQLAFAAKDFKVRHAAAEALFEVVGDYEAGDASAQLLLADIDWALGSTALSKHRVAIETTVMSSI